MFNFFNTFKNNFGIILLIALDFFLVLSLHYLSIKKIVSDEFFYIGSIALLGWLFTFWINITVQNKEVKKRLEIEAFKEINKTVVKGQETLANISTYYVSRWELKIENSIQNKKLSNNAILLKVNTLLSLLLEIRKQNERLFELWKNFIISIEAYEIVLTQFGKLKKVLNKEFRKITSMTDDFENYIIKLSRKKLLEEDLVTLKEKMRKINENIMDIGCYLGDYRIELMNSMLGDIFHSKVPRRKPKKPYKTLTQIAKEDILSE